MVKKFVPFLSKEVKVGEEVVVKIERDKAGIKILRETEVPEWIDITEHVKVEIRKSGGCDGYYIAIIDPCDLNYAGKPKTVAILGLLDAQAPGGEHYDNSNGRVRVEEGYKLLKAINSRYSFRIYRLNPEALEE